MGWIEEGIGVAEAARKHGFEVGHRGIRPCPRCGADKRGRRDKRPPAVLRQEGKAWWCHACQSGGGPRAFGEIDPIEMRPEPDRGPGRLHPDEVWDVWESCEAIDDETCADLKEKGIDPIGAEFSNGARGMAHQRRGWWDYTLPLTLPMYDSTGQMRALHARKLKGEGQKGLSPKGRPVAGLMFNDQGAIGAALGDDVILGVVCEGATDHLAMSGHVAQRHTEEAGVWGGVSGSWSGLRHHHALEWLLLTDPDKVGDKYAQDCCRALAGAVVRRYRGDGDVCDLLKRGVTLLDMLRGSYRVQ